MVKENKKLLQFRLSMREYADFWYIGNSFNLRDKHDIFRKMLSVIKEIYCEKDDKKGSI